MECDLDIPCAGNVQSEILLVVVLIRVGRRPVVCRLHVADGLEHVEDRIDREFVAPGVIRAVGDEAVVDGVALELDRRFAVHTREVLRRAAEATLESLADGVGELLVREELKVVVALLRRRVLVEDDADAIRVGHLHAAALVRISSVGVLALHLHCVRSGERAFVDFLVRAGGHVVLSSLVEELVAVVRRTVVAHEVQVGRGALDVQGIVGHWEVPAALGTRVLRGPEMGRGSVLLSMEGEVRDVLDGARVRVEPDLDVVRPRDGDLVPLVGILRVRVGRLDEPPQLI
mmetsp:Transcript_8214/g.30862  ORF Transcript_8214/g.30862 Transcript_8214/m.30862 type:complete len:288 (-) Transcript_8214:1159-2022(-)